MGEFPAVLHVALGDLVPAQERAPCPRALLGEQSHIFLFCGLFLASHQYTAWHPGHY